MPQSRDRVYFVFWKKGNREPDLAFTPRSWCPSCGVDVEGVQTYKKPAKVAPPESLIGCVLHLTGNVPPEFVDRATYQARPAYVFADADEAWVVGIDCTAARPALMIASLLS